MAIEDFGEKIGGARKDIIREHSLRVDDLDNMNDAEKDSFVMKKYIWEKPDYSEMINNGIPIRVVYFIKLVKDATPVKPVIYSFDTENIKNEKRANYIKFVTELRDSVMNLKTEDEVLNFYDNFMNKYILRKIGSRYVEVLPQVENCITPKLIKVTQVKNFYNIDNEIKMKQFGYTLEDKVMKQYDIIKFDKNNVKFTKDYSHEDWLSIKSDKGIKSYRLKKEFSNPLKWKEDSFFIVKDNQIVKRNIQSEEKAKKYILENTGKEINKEWKKSKKVFKPKQLETIFRDGEDYRKGKDITGEDMLKVFNFRGGEFGIWLKENDRQFSLNYCFEALKDLCQVLNISENSISLDNTLCIAFGARGNACALAHYEPLRKVINLTKMKGAGSLAHEWCHALDHAIGRKITGTEEFITEYNGYYKNNELKVIKELIDTMKYKTVCNNQTLMEQIKKHENNIKALEVAVNSLFPKEYMNKKQLELKKDLVKEMINSAEQKDFYLNLLNEDNYINNTIEKLSKLRKETIGKSISTSDKSHLMYKQNMIFSSKDRIGKPEIIETDFYKNSKYFDSIYAMTDRRYWQSNVELFARAFACYVYDNLGYRSDYLCGHAEMISTIKIDEENKLQVIKGFPEGKERESINKCISKVIEFAKEKNILHDICSIRQQDEELEI